MNCQDRVFPSWNRRGGCASKKKARSLRRGADGVVIMVNVDVEMVSGTDHPVCAFIRRLRSIFLMAQPPLLSEEGNTLPCNSFPPSTIAGISGAHRAPLQWRENEHTAAVAHPRRGYIQLPRGPDGLDVSRRLRRGRHQGRTPGARR